MTTVIILVGAIALGASVIAWGYFKVRDERQRAREREQANFKDILIQQLRKTGTTNFDYQQVVQDHAIKEDIAADAAKQVYRQLVTKFLLDDVITNEERKKLDVLRSALSISRIDAELVETSQKAEKYKSAAIEAIADGVITPQEEQALERLRSQLGLKREQALESVKKSVQDGYVELFRQVINDGRITGEELEELRRFREALNLSPGAANFVVRADALALYRLWFQNVVQDGEVTDQEEQGLRWLRDEFGLHDDVGEFESRLADAKRLAAFRSGNLPAVKLNKLLESGEIGHWAGPCIYEWATSRDNKSVDGELLVTSKQIVFASPTRSFRVVPARIVDVSLERAPLIGCRAVAVTASTTKGTGYYYVAPLHDLEAILIGLVKKHKYQANLPAMLTRHIPDDVRREVYHRDGGKCARCESMSYLEFDHIIPHSRGGANTVKNVQLLCRGCNGEKSDRI